MKGPSYNDLVFINCPFDNNYQPILMGIIYAVYRCGFFPVTAMEEDNSLDNRIDKIFRIVEKCRFGVHDISRIELNENGLPRFNMPFELGVFFAPVIVSNFTEFLSKLPGLANRVGYKTLNEIPFADYCTFVEEAIRDLLPAN